ncbi:MAG: RNA 3'-phosphate cyclase [Anaerolineae bacterium]|nr:RNA 3'-phosphate cyclase [Anaerolineae bacterium]
MLTIDGSHGEGGGQILRTALALSAITGRPMRIERIRAGRKNPGLRPQHLTAVHAAAAICGAQLEGDKLDSQALTLVPGDPPRPGEYVFDVAGATQGGSAGSVGLVLQTVLLPLALAKGESRLTIRGGTHVPWAPPVSYLTHVFLPTLARMGVQAQIELVRWGFYPAGGGEIRVQIEGKATPNPIQLTERGKLCRVWGTAAVMNLPAHIPQRMANRARNVLAEAGIQAQVEPRRLRGAGPGAGIFLFAEYESADQSTYAGFTAYGSKGLPAERVAETACESLLTHHRSGSPADPHLADQLALPMVLAQGESRIVTSQVSRHLLTNAWVIGQFLTQVLEITGKQGASGTIIAKGTRHD